VTQDHHLTIEDSIDTLGKSILGLTIACARCHDHKYDPITTADYYALYGILDSTRYPFPGCEHTKVPRDLMPLFPPADRKQAEFVGPLPRPEFAYAVTEATPHNVKIHQRGDPGTPAEAVPRRDLQRCGGRGGPGDGGSGRLALAEAWTRPDHLLTARVLVNRVWRHHFGAGLVKTPTDFGPRGEPPTHPELLDWLAARFVKDG